MEVYDPGPGADQKPNMAATPAFYRGRNVMFEIEPAYLESFLPKRGQTLPIRLEIPLAQLPTGKYTCQIKLIMVDQTGRRFGFQRADMQIWPSQTAPATQAPADAPPAPRPSGS